MSLARKSSTRLFENPLYLGEENYVQMSENKAGDEVQLFTMSTLSEQLVKFEKMFSVDNLSEPSMDKKAKKHGIKRLFSLGSASPSSNKFKANKNGDEGEISRSTSLPKTFRSPLTSLNNVGVARSRSMTHKLLKKDEHFKVGARETPKSQSNIESDLMRLHQNFDTSNGSFHDKRPPPCPTKKPWTSRTQTRLHGFKGRPHVLHKLCNWAECNFRVNDCVIVFSKENNSVVSWAGYFQKLLKINQFANVNLQPVEEFSILSEELKVGNLKAEADLARIEEGAYHSKCQIIIIDESMLEWVYKNPSLILGKLFNSETTLSLFLGVENQDVRTEHKAALLTYSQWKKMKICQDGQFPDQFYDTVRSILGRPYPIKPPSSEDVPEIRTTFKLWPEKITVCQRRALLLLSSPISKSDKIDVIACSLEGESKDAGRRLCAKIIDVSTIEITISADDFADFSQNKDGGKSRIKLIINDKQRLPTSGPETATLVCESPLESLTDLLNDSSIVADTMVKFNAGFGPGNLDARMASIVSKESNHKLFENLQTSLPEIEDKIDDKFPTFLHWAAYHGLEKTVVTLLTLPGSHNAANIANADGRVAHELAESRNHLDLARLLRTKLQLRNNHKYEYPGISPSYENEPFLMTPTKTIDRGSTPSSCSGSTYDTPRSLENWYVVPPPPVSVSRGVPEPETTYISMKPRSNSTGSRKLVESSSGAISKVKSNSTTVIGSKPEIISHRNERARSYSEEKNDYSFYSSRPPSREEFIKTCNSLLGQEVVLKDFHNPDEEAKIRLEKVNVNDYEKSMPVNIPGRSKKGSPTKDLSKVGSKFGRNLFKVSKYSTLPSKLPLSKKRTKNDDSP